MVGLLLSFNLLAAPAIEPAPGLAFLNGNLDFSLSGIVGEKLAAEAQATKRLARVVSAQDLADLLNVSQTRCLVDADDAECMVQINETLKVRYVLVSDLRALKDRMVLNLRVLDTETGKAGLRLNREYLTEKVLLNDVPKLAQAVVASLFKETVPLEDTFAIEINQRRNRRISYGAGGGLSLIGLGLMVAAAANQNQAQQTWDQNPNKDAAGLQALYDAESKHQSQYLLGLGTSVTGLALALGGWWRWR